MPSTSSLVDRKITDLLSAVHAEGEFQVSVSVSRTVLIAGCFLYSFLHPSNLAFAGLAFLTLWYFYIPFLLALVSLVWIVVQRIAKTRTGQ